MPDHPWGAVERAEAKARGQRFSSSANLLAVVDDLRGYEALATEAVRLLRALSNDPPCDERTVCFFCAATQREQHDPSCLMTEAASFLTRYALPGERS